MKSYALAIAVSMLLAAVYGFQNSADVLVKFLLWEVALPQGIWEVMLFAAGGVLMWMVSLLALMESRSKYSRQVKEKETRIKELEEERTSLMGAIRKSGSHFPKPEHSSGEDAAEPNSKG
ncbi:MAG: LapA family protein [Thermovirgaceae bacterium]|nr:LapA family protein [Thermovirgaceae bacterium]